MKDTITPIGKALLAKELDNNELLCISSKGRKHIYSVTHKTAPNVINEIGRLRELSYRNVGSGTGKDCDIDSLDIADVPYKQLIVWDPDVKEILGGYRYILCKDLETENNEFKIGTSRLFEFSDQFKTDYLPFTIELGRSFVKPDYQIGTNLRKGLFVLDNLWEGLGKVISLNPEIKYFFGQVSVFSFKNPKTKDIILYFLEKYFHDDQNLVKPKSPYLWESNNDDFKRLFNRESLRENYSILSRIVRSYNENIPPLINTYINTSPHLKTFGAVTNPYFINMIDIGILIAIDDINETKKNRYIYSFNPK